MKKAFLFAAVVLLPFLGNTQTKSQNYIKTTAYQVATSDTLVADDEKIESITYVDGLGRPLQSISTRAGGNRENIVSYMEYDQLGMQPKQYLPWASNGQVPVMDGLNFIAPATLSSDITTFYNNKYGTTPNPYSETRYEKSPLFRPVEQGAPGAPWEIQVNSDNDRTIKFDYGFNSNVVHQFSVNFINGDYSDPELVYDSNYAFNELTVTVTRDENWQTADGIHGETYEFKNKSGQVILKRTSVEDLIQGPQYPNYHDTYYVYDDYGNLTYVLSPEASDEMVKSGALVSGAQTILDNLGYQYKYDRRNRLVWKKLPGKGYEVIIYDTQDRPILTQDALMRADDPYKYLFTKYDCLGRVAYTGYHISSYTLRIDIQNDVPNQANCEVMTSNSGSIGGLNVYYTNTAYPTTNLELLTINYYDTYVDYGTLIRPTNVYGINPTLSETHGLLTVSKVKVLGTSDWITSLSEYDQKGGVVYSASKNDYLNTTDISSSDLDFVGKPIETTTTHLKAGNATITTLDYFTYDQTGRLATHKQKVDTEPLQLIAKNYYDELGQLVQKDVGGETVIGGYTAIEDADVSYDGIITRTTGGSGPSWTSGAKTKGEILTDGGVQYTYNNPLEDKALRVGLEKTNSTSLGWADFDYAIYHLIADTDNDGSKNLQVIINNGTPIDVSEEYDHGDTFSIERVGSQIQFKKNGASPFYTYNEVGVGTPMVGKAALYFGYASITDFELFGSNINSKLQSIDYTYNIRRWLTEINDIDDQSLIPKLFNFKINYNQLENNTTGTELFNGNIAQTFWKSANPNDGSIRGYTYTYDDLNRIKEAKGYKGTTSSSLSSYDVHNLLNLNYDKNGNIGTLKRNGADQLDNAYGTWDDLSYSYAIDSNKLQTVTDNANPGIYKDLGFKDGYVGLEYDFEYDVNGNMTKDRNKSIDSISYNHLNLPVSIVYETLPKQINYVYDATGVKLKKSVTDEGTVTTEYAGNYIYNNAEDGTMKLQFFNHPEGYIEPVADTGKSVKGSLGGITTYSGYSYVFQYKDHLGNVRLSYSDSDLDGSINASSEIIEESSYYPFGLKQKGYNNTVSGNGNNLAQTFKFNGVELNESLGLDLYEMDFRTYAPAIGRFNGNDPVTHFSQGTSVAFDNNPVFWADPSGADSFYGGRNGSLANYGVGSPTSGNYDDSEAKEDNLDVANNKRSKKDIRKLVRRRNRRYLRFDDSGNVTLDFSNLRRNETVAALLASDEGLNLINDLVSATENYLYESRDATIGNDAAGTRMVVQMWRDANGVVNASNNGTDSNGGHTHRPAAGYDGQVIVAPKAGQYETDANGNIVKKSRSAIVFHELAENFERTTNGVDYWTMRPRGAHQNAITREGRWHRSSNDPGNATSIVNPTPSRKKRRRAFHQARSRL